MPDDLIDLRWRTVAPGLAGDGLDPLDEGERARAARFRFDDDRHLYIAAHALLRRTLSERGPLPPAAWRFTAGPNGKPELAEPSFGLTFNLTHCRGFAACAVARGTVLGIDAEVPGGRFDADLPAAVLTPPELTLLDATDDREGAFLALWTLREAYVKARGTGLSEPFERYRADLDPPRVIPVPGDECPWRAWQARLGPAIVALVSDGGLPIRCREATSP
jgi:4'-phosphopantetheinyl transferase